MVLPFVLLVPYLPTQNANGPVSAAITIRSICDRLHQTTGDSYDFAANFSDHAVYFRLNNSEPERLRKLTASCLRGHWSQNGKQWRLVSDSVPSMPDWFPAAWKRAFDPAGKSKGVLPDPSKLYALRVGDQEPNSGTIIRRLLGTMYESGQAQWMVENPLYEVIQYLGDRGKAIVKVPESIKPKPRMGGSSLGAGHGKWSKETPDPLMKQSSELLSAVADTVAGEVAMPIPDGMATAGFFMDHDLPLDASLKALSQWMEFSVENDVLVGKLTAADAGARTQASRTALIKACNPMPDFFDTPVLARLEQDEPPLASIAMTDIVALMMGGAAIDASPHYPWDIRLYRSLSNRDWAAMREPDATVGDLSAAAQAAIDKLAQKSRMIFEQSIPVADGVVPRSTTVRLIETSDAPYLMYYGDRPPEVTDALNVASQRIWRGYDDKVARYLPIRRRLLTVVIGSEFKVPFSKVELPTDRTPLRFSELPKSARDEITKLESDQRNQERARNTPPPW